MDGAHHAQVLRMDVDTVIAAGVVTWQANALVLLSASEVIPGRVRILPTGRGV